MNRRTFLKASVAAAASTAGCRGQPPRPEGQWSNWSGNQVAQPRTRIAPRDEDELRRAIVGARGSIRATGASHSFSPLCKTSDTLVTLDALTGIISTDEERQRATCWAGSRIRDLGASLWERGQAFVNQGDVDPQSVAGACGTSTHGTGVTLGSFSSAVRGVRLVTPAGDVVEADEERNADVLRAAATSLGCLGIVTQMTLQNRPAYHLHEREWTEGLDAVLGRIDALMAENRHFELWTFVEAPLAIVKTLNETDRDATEEPGYELPVDSVLWAACELAHRFPGIDGSLQRLLTRLHSATDRVGRSYEIFPSPRNVRFNEMEYEVPLARGPECLVEVLETIRRSELPMLFPLEYRTVAADDAWLSPFHDRPSAAISVHQYAEIDYVPLFRLVEPVFRKYDGRPHWGKLHGLAGDDFRELYRRWDDFQRLRRELDPEGRLLNPHLRSVFGVEA